MIWSRVFAVLRRLLRREIVEESLDEEILSYLEHDIEARIAAGELPVAARRSALLELGGREQVKERVREHRAGAWLDTVAADMRFAVRTFRRAPGFTLVVILTLALGIGATTAVFSVVDLLLFRDLPFTNEDRLVSIGILYGTVEQEFLFGAQYGAIQEELQSVEAWTSFSGTSGCDIATDVPRRLSCARVEANFIPTLGLNLALGRNFTVEEDRRNGPRIALISYGLWQSDFAAEQSVVGATISIDGDPHEIIGVLEPDFELPTLAPTDIVVPQRIERSFLPQLEGGPNPPLRVFARLRPGVEVTAAEQELAALIGLVDERAEGIPVRARLVRDRQIGRAKIAAWILLGVVGSGLMIVLANVANLMLARTSGRQHELGVRAALGAGRPRLIRQLLTETLLLSFVGGALGCGAALLLLRVFVLIAPDGIPRLAEASLDGRVLVVAVAASVLSGLSSGLLPASIRWSPAAVMGSSGVAPSNQRVARTLIVAQIAVSMVLLTGATLLVRSFWNVTGEARWTEGSRILIADISLGSVRYAEQREALAFFHDLEARLKAVPGFTKIAVSDSLPPAGEIRNVRMGIPDQAEPVFPVWRYITPGYFETLGIPVLRGRSFVEADSTSTARVFILSEALARQRFGTIDALGQTFGSGVGGEVVGIVANTPNRGLSVPADPEYYVLRKDPRIGDWPSGAPGFHRAAYVALQTSLPVNVAVDEIRRYVTEMDASVAVTVEEMTNRIERETAPQAFNATLTGVFAILGMLLACVGLYGVTAFLVVRRTQEFGLRMAVGATRASNTVVALTGAAKCTLAGLVIGTSGALATTRFLASVLYEVPARDPWTLATAAAMLAAASLFAAWIAARRAATVDPLVALRHD